MSILFPLHSSHGKTIQDGSFDLSEQNCTSASKIDWVRPSSLSSNPQLFPKDSGNDIDLKQGNLGETYNIGGNNQRTNIEIVNYDLPWAIIRLIQRAGRVDRIGQESEKIYCYSFKPADGVETIIRLRSRLFNRLTENAEVIGTDEEFFPDQDSQDVIDLYNEKST